MSAGASADSSTVPSAGARAAAAILAEREPLASAITDALYRELPQLDAKYGAAGRAKCLQDMRYTLEHLAPAVDLARAPMFAGYVRWLDTLLRARNVATDELVRCLELTEQVVRERLPADEAEAVAPILRAGLRELSGGGSVRSR